MFCCALVVSATPASPLARFGAATRTEPAWTAPPAPGRRGWYNFTPGGFKRLPRSMVAVAQLVESRIVIPVVAGSNPVSHPINSST